MANLNKLPLDSYEREAWLENYLVGRITNSMVEKLNLHLGRVIRGRATSPFGREAAENLQAMSREEFSAWVIRKV